MASPRCNARVPSMSPRVFKWFGGMTAPPKTEDISVMFFPPCKIKDRMCNWMTCELYFSAPRQQQKSHELHCQADWCSIPGPKKREEKKEINKLVIIISCTAYQNMLVYLICMLANSHYCQLCSIDIHIFNNDELLEWNGNGKYYLSISYWILNSKCP